MAKGTTVGQRAMRKFVVPECQTCGVLVVTGVPRIVGRPRSYCDPCRKAARVASHTRWRADNPGSDWANSLRRKYGIELSAWEQLFAEQHGRCGVCGQPQKARLHTDHDHTTGAVRALLCGNCNKSLGLLGEDPARIRALADYVEHWGVSSHR